MKKILLIFILLATTVYVYGQEYCENFKIVSIYDIPPTPQTPGGNYFLLLLTLEEDNLDNLDIYANLFFMNELGDTISIPTGPSSTLPLYTTDTIPYILQLNSPNANQDFPENFIGKLVIIHSIHPVCEVNYSNTLTNSTIIKRIPDVKIYPNPFFNILQIETERKIDNILIVNSNGSIVGQYSHKNNMGELNLEKLKKGNYFIILQFRDGEKLVKSVIKN